MVGRRLLQKKKKLERPKVIILGEETENEYVLIQSVGPTNNVRSNEPINTREGSENDKTILIESA